MASITELCLKHTILNAEEAKCIEELAVHLQLIADVSQSDIFIDCPTADKSAALVVAQAHPSTFPSLYRSSVVGQLAYAHNEPAVLFSLVSGQPIVGSRGVSQEQINIQQNVVPIFHRGKVIGALIMEQDISEKVEQEKNVERLMESTEQLSRTLLSVAMSEGSMPSLMHEGIIVFDEKERVTYTNPQARAMMRGIGHHRAPEGLRLAELFPGRWNEEMWPGRGGMINEEIRFGNAAFVLKAVPIYQNQRAVGGLMLIRDITDLIEKDKQLMIKSAVIKEIHHRVKNNLQTVASLLRLQMRRTKLPEVEKVYRDSINRISSIAVIHEMLAYGGLQTIPFNDVVDRIAKNVVSSTAKPDQSIHVAIYGTALQLSSEPATTLALVLNELIQNCVLHAFGERESGEIVISIGCDERNVSLRVTDNGTGMTRADETKGKHHLGLRIAETLVQENLGGSMRVESSAGGTSVHIAFPLSESGSKEEDAP